MVQRNDLLRMRALMPTLFALALLGCVSTVGAPERERGLAGFMALPAPAILSYPSTLTVDASLTAMRQQEYVAPLAGAFDSGSEGLALLGRIRDSAPSLRHGVTALVRPALPDASPEAAETWVLFVWPTWQLTYQRLPPRLDLVRLELGVIGKVIPRGQVMEGRGSLALRTAVWETRCHRFAADGAYFPVSEWLANDAARWRQALAEVREACGRQIAMTFEQGVAKLGGLSLPAP